MEDPKMLEESLFWLRRQKNGWPPVPEEMLLAAERITEHDLVENQRECQFCGVPVWELTEREAKAGLVLLMTELFKQKQP